ncbi:MAG: dienelactone hydrolase family protein [Saprospiraceae bacterium]|nr:dienelactone hydrolase family protein [Saprospiraceae bacterium]
MKKLFILILFTMIEINLNAQSCCGSTTTFASNDGNMAVFVGDKNFRDIHQSPAVYVHHSMVGGAMITFKTNEKDANAYLIKAKKITNKWLFVYQEWWGLNDNIKKQADAFYNDLGGAVNVLAIDMYDGKLATTPDVAGKYMQEAKEDRLEAIMKGAIDYVGKKAKIASVGWCFGGGLSLKSAILEGKQAVGCVMYYGMPVQDVEKLKTLQTDVLGHFATEEWISKKVIEEFAANMKSANKVLEYKIYDAPHAFANPSNQKFNKEFADDAFKKSIAYFKKKFGLK